MRRLLLCVVLPLGLCGPARAQGYGVEELAQGVEELGPAFDVDVRWRGWVRQQRRAQFAPPGYPYGSPFGSDPRHFQRPITVYLYLNLPRGPGGWTGPGAWPTSGGAAPFVTEGVPYGNGGGWPSSPDLRSQFGASFSGTFGAGLPAGCAPGSSRSAGGWPSSAALTAPGYSRY